MDWVVRVPVVENSRPPCTNCGQPLAVTVVERCRQVVALDRAEAETRLDTRLAASEFLVCSSDDLSTSDREVAVENITGVPS